MRQIAGSVLRLMAGASIAACGGDGAMPPPPPGAVSVLLTDSPAPLIAAAITISGLQVMASHGGGSRDLGLTPLTLNLLHLAGTRLQLVDAVPVPAGDYSGVRFIISGGYVEVQNSNGTSSFFASPLDYAGLPPSAAPAGPLNLFNAATTGVIADLPDSGITLGGDTTIVLVDFDAGNSFSQQPGQSSAWAMHPVLTTTLLPPP